MTQTSPVVMGGHVPEVLHLGDATDTVSESLTLKRRPGCVIGTLRVLRLAVEQRRPRGKFRDPQGLLLSWVGTSLGCFTLGILLSWRPHPGLSPWLYSPLWGVTAT